MDLKVTLEELCLNIRNERSSFYPTPSITNRATYITQKITEMNLTYTVDSFQPSPFYRLPVLQDENGPFKYFNIIVKFPCSNNSSDDSVIFTAHHDVNNTKSQNCQDNTASIVNLLKLCSYLKDKNDLTRTVYVVFTDAEEFGGKGAFRLSEQILEGEYGKVNYIVNSELTAFGEHIWSERVPTISPLRRKLSENLEELNEKATPFNDSYIFRQWGLDSICLGTLPKDSEGRLMTEYWRICHSENDTIEIANYDHMERYVQFLLKLI